MSALFVLRDFCAAQIDYNVLADTFLLAQIRCRISEISASTRDYISAILMIIKAIGNILEFPVAQRELRTRVATCVNMRACARACKTSDSSNNWLLQF